VTTKPYLDRVEVYALSEDGRILGGRYDGDGFMLPGGTVDGKESLRKAAEREAFEEAGWRIKVTGAADFPMRHKDYEKPYSDKIAKRAEKYRGTKTVCMLAEVVGDEAEVEYPDDVMTDVDLWTFDEAIAACDPEHGGPIKKNLEALKAKLGDRVKAAGHVSTHTTTHNGDVYDVMKAIELSKALPDVPVNIELLERPNRSSSTGFSKKRYEAADVGYPILLHPDGALFDGRHRLAKLQDQAIAETRVKMLTPEILAASKQSAAEPTVVKKKYTFTPKLEASFTPDFSPEELKEITVPKLDHYLGPNADVGFRAWYEDYAAGKRTEDDARQIKRWMGVKARWLPLFQREPTARRAIALANWGISPDAHVPPERRKDLKLMYKALGKKHEKKAADRPFTICVDLDGTLAEESKPFNKERIGEIKADARRWMEAFADAGARIIIWTVRGNVTLVREWLDSRSIPYDYINYNPDQPEDGSRKVIADLYLDDRGVRAEGSWNDFGALVLDKLVTDKETP
jgi:8-oxo-dGTP pyrophosphatase MutT (NUDIX family)